MPTELENLRAEIKTLHAQNSKLQSAGKEFVTRMDEVRRDLRDWTTLRHAEELMLEALK